MLAFLNSIVDYVNNMSPAILAGVAMGLEMLMRLIPTKKPLSIMWIVRDVITGVGKVFGAVAGLMDKILPQRIAGE